MIVKPARPVRRIGFHSSLAARLLSINSQLPDGDGDVELPAELWQQLIEAAQRHNKNDDFAVELIKAHRELGELLGMAPDLYSIWNMLGVLRARLNELARLERERSER